MKTILFIAFTLFVVCSSHSQNIRLSGENISDSLKKELAASKPDSNRVKIFLALYNADFLKVENYYYLQQALALAEKIDHKRLHSRCLRAVGSFALFRKQQPSEALEYLLKALRVSESINDEEESGKNNKVIGQIYVGEKDYLRAKPYLFKAIKLLEEVRNDDNLSITFNTLGHMYSALIRYDSALFWYSQAYAKGLKANISVSISALMEIGKVHTNQGDFTTAMKYLRQSLEMVKISQNLYDQPNAFYAGIYIAMAELFRKKGQNDSTLFYAKQAFDISNKGNIIKELNNAGKFLFDYYDGKNEKEAYKYLRIITKIRDSLNPVEKAREILNLAFKEQQRLQSIEDVRKAANNRIVLNSVLGGLFTCLIIAIFLFRNNRQKQKANVKLHEQQTKTEQALHELKATQTQLIQQEKMASLGELTAGIAHEIQNPLNFVNNFSDINTELVDEIELALKKNNKGEALAIAEDLKENLQKITHHGKRADAIVKGMLQHSRASSGKKEPTDLNALANEYLRLSYHGFRGKDKDFNANFTTYFDENLGQIEVVQQDIGRVLLNLYNNAFYAINEKKKQLNGTFEPTVTVSTKRAGGEVEIIVRDNGLGIPQKILDKIFQPFFTTKPTGQGTGLGLSLSYDIIKAHNGELKVETKEGEYAEFTVQLPA